MFIAVLVLSKKLDGLKKLLPCYTLMHFIAVPGLWLFNISASSGSVAQPHPHWNQSLPCISAKASRVGGMWESKGFAAGLLLLTWAFARQAWLLGLGVLFPFSPESAARWVGKQAHRAAPPDQGLPWLKWGGSTMLQPGSIPRSLAWRQVTKWCHTMLWHHATLWHHVMSWCYAMPWHNLWVLLE